jgi:molybdopterin-guanine dinucleotide biosynthesis protein A
LDYSAVILAGGSSKRFGQDKGLAQLGNKPLVKHVLDAIGDIVKEKIVVVSSKAQAENYRRILSVEAHVVVDAGGIQTPLVGVLTGFEAAGGEYSIVLPCDVPFVSRDVVSLLLELCINKAAVIPRWPNCYIEPLHAVYRTQLALEAAKTPLSKGELDLKAMVDRLRGVRYVSTLVLQQLDPQLRTFFNVNTALDLKKAESMLKRPNSYSSSLPK